VLPRSRMALAGAGASSADRCASIREMPIATNTTAPIANPEGRRSQRHARGAGIWGWIVPRRLPGLICLGVRDPNDEFRSSSITGAGPTEPDGSARSHSVLQREEPGRQRAVNEQIVGYFAATRALTCGLRQTVVAPGLRSMRSPSRRQKLPSTCRSTPSNCTRSSWSSIQTSW
jgi:hypothetical protein